MKKTGNAARALEKGGFVIVYDGDEREGEADLMVHPKFITPEKIEKLRKDAGGLICLAISPVYAKKLGFQFFTEIMGKSGFENISCKKTAYGDEPAFALPINHKKVYTGIPDKDRALTIREFAKTIEKENAKEDFEKNFYAPGHVFVLIGRGLEKRKGHTELGLELAKRAGLSECMAMCEMLGKGKALSKNEAKRYAERNGFAFVEGREIYGENE